MNTVRRAYVHVIKESIIPQLEKAIGPGLWKREANAFVTGLAGNFGGPLRGGIYEIKIFRSGAMYLSLEKLEKEAAAIIKERRT